MDKEKRLDYLEKSSRIRKYTDLIAMLVNLSEILEDTNEMKSYILGVSKKLCIALQEEL